VARSADREDTGNHRRYSLAKIGAESKEFLPRDEDSGANRIARTILHAVIAGLDPAIHAAARRVPTDVVVIGTSAWTTGSSPVVTKEESASRRGMKRFAV
jgi:hypothetical protein